MTAVFLHFFNLSVMAGWMVLAVVLLRLCLKKAPRWITCLLWGLVALRLVIPFTVESPISLLPTANTVISSSDSGSSSLQLDSGVDALNEPINEWLQQSAIPYFNDDTREPSEQDAVDLIVPEEMVDELEEEPKTRAEQVLSIAAPLWLVGIGMMLLYELFSMLRVRSRVLDAVLLRDNIWQSDRIASPFILGLFRPRIYVPYGLDESVLEQVLSHERAHLHRRDHWIKPFAFTLLAVYWYNPLLWVAYILLCRDIEVACDQRVLRGFSEEQKKQYAFALLQCGVERRSIAACPLAFGEVGIKQRIKSVMHYRKPLLWVVIVSLVISTVAAVCLLTVPSNKQPVVLSSTRIEPTQYHRFTDIDSEVTVSDSTEEWMWQHAENLGDRGGDTDIPLLLCDSKTEFDQVVEALESPNRLGMHSLFKLYAYDEAFFENKSAVWLYVPGYDEGEFTCEIALEETNKGLRYAVSLQYANTTMFTTTATSCEYLILLEVDRDVMEQAASLSTRHEKSPLAMPEETDGMERHSLGSADMDGDGEPENLYIYDFLDPEELPFLTVCRADGTVLLRESTYPMNNLNGYLVSQEDGSSALLLVNADNYSYPSESYGVLSLMDGQRTVLAYDPNGGYYSSVDFDALFPYVLSLSRCLENAQLLFEWENGELYYGKKLGDTPRYTPLGWMDEFRNSPEDTTQDIFENVLASYSTDYLSNTKLDMDGDGKDETVSVIRYIYAEVYYRFALLVRDADGAIQSCVFLYSHYSGDDLNQLLYVYQLLDKSGKDRIQVVDVSNDETYYVDEVTIDSKKDFSPMTASEWLDYVEKTGAKMLYYIRGIELYYPDAEEEKSYLTIDADKYTIENYNEAIVAYNSFLNNRRYAYDGSATFYLSDMGITAFRYTIADVTGDEVPELLIQENGINVFSYMQGRVMHLYQSPVGMEVQLLSNGNLWAQRIGDGNHYRYVTFFAVGTTRIATFGYTGDPAAGASYYVGDEWMTKEEYDRRTADYFEAANSPAHLIWYEYN